MAEDRAREIHQIDAETGAIMCTIESDCFVTGISWVNGEPWHGTMEAEQSELRRIDPETGEVLERLEMPAGVAVSAGSRPTAPASFTAVAAPAARCAPCAGPSPDRERSSRFVPCA